MPSTQATSFLFSSGIYILSNPWFTASTSIAITPFMLFTVPSNDNSPIKHALAKSASITPHAQRTPKAMGKS